MSVNYYVLSTACIINCVSFGIFFILHLMNIEIIKTLY